ncbi:MAG: molybdopterin cofactor-binding domain-containing protein, partial [Sciscionella sp.]
MADHRRTPEQAETDTDADTGQHSFGRRRFVGYLLAAPALAVGVQWIGESVDPQAANAAIPTLPEPEELFDLGDLQDLAAAPTSHLITVHVHPDGTASFALPRAEVGQGITTSTTMVIAEELDLPMNKVTVTLADARPELLLNQLTGGSNTTRSTYQPIRMAAAIARQQLVHTAAQQMNVPASELTTADGMITHSSGKSASYGSLAKAAGANKTTKGSVQLKSPSQFKIIGTPQGRVDAHDIVQGKKVFAMDMVLPGAMPTMVARPPTING